MTHEEEVTLENVLLDIEVDDEGIMIDIGDLEMRTTMKTSMKRLSKMRKIMHFNLAQ